MDKKYLVGGVLLITAVLVLGLNFPRPGPSVVEKTVERVVERLGGFSGPKITSTFLVFNGIEHQYQTSRLNKASTTICSLPTPKAASSTLVNWTYINTQGSTTVLMLEVFDAAAPGKVATTAATVLTTLPFDAAGNTRQTSGTTSVGWKFAPNRFLSFLYTVKGVEGTTNTLEGRCNAEFLVY